MTKVWSYFGYDLFKISRFGKEAETESKVAHNERLEFLGDAVVEFITSVHLFHMFPDLEEGGLATYRYSTYIFAAASHCQIILYLVSCKSFIFLRPLVP